MLAQGILFGSKAPKSAGLNLVQKASGLRFKQTLALNNLRPPANNSATKRRVGRGIGGGLGKTSGRGQKGQHARGGNIGFNLYEGGQTPLWKRVPKTGFTNRAHRQNIVPLNLDTIQKAIDDGRLDASQPITMHHLYTANLIGNGGDGVKLLGKGKLSSPVDIEVSQASKSAIQGVEAAGGRIVCGWYNKLALRVLLKPELFEETGTSIPRRARPPPKKMPYYLDYENRGYLSQEVQLEILTRRAAERAQGKASN